MRAGPSTPPKESHAEMLARFKAKHDATRLDPGAYDLAPGVNVVSFSGGRTSGLLLHKLIERNGAVRVNKDVLIAFRNTGKEREESLDFVNEVSLRWGVNVRWLEYRYLRGLPRDQKHSFAEVDYRTASRKGEPFDQIIDARGDHRVSEGKDLIVPNQGMRWCTGELKQKTLLRWLRSLGVRKFTNHIGIRFDEPKRWMKIVDCPSGRMAGESPRAPLFDGRIVEKDVDDFWAAQPFNLGLKKHEGNCDLCFLKAKWKRQAVLQEDPSRGDWWAGHEETTGCLFKLKQPYRELQRVALIDREAGTSCRPGTDDEEESECHCTD